MDGLIIQILGAVGGAGIIIIGLSKIVGAISRDRLKERDRKRTELVLELTRQRYGMRRVQGDKFAESQFDIYVELWESLQALRFTVDALWYSVTKQNISNLLRQLRTTEQKVNAWSLFFEDEHLTELKQLFEVIESFHTGKLTLIDIRSQKDLDYIKVEEIESQIVSNGHYRDQLDHLIETLRHAFRERLSAADTTDLE